MEEERRHEECEKDSIPVAGLEGDGRDGKKKAKDVGSLEKLKNTLKHVLS